MGRLWDGHGTVTFISQRVLTTFDRSWDGYGTAMGRLWDGEIIYFFKN